MAAFGGLNRVSFSGKNDFHVSPIVLKPERLTMLQDHLMLFFTGFARTASDIAAEQIRVTRQRHKELTEMQRMVDEAITILNGNGSLSAFGKLLHESWLLKKGLTDRISTSLIDEIYDRARKSGSIGGKLLGAGGGGFLLLFVEGDKQPKVKKALADLLQVPFKFETYGSQIIFNEPSF